MPTDSVQERLAKFDQHWAKMQATPVVRGPRSLSPEDYAEGGFQEWLPVTITDIETALTSEGSPYIKVIFTLKNKNFYVKQAFFGDTSALRALRRAACVLNTADLLEKSIDVLVRPEAQWMNVVSFQQPKTAPALEVTADAK